MTDIFLLFAIFCWLCIILIAIEETFFPQKIGKIEKWDYRQGRRGNRDDN